MKGWRGMEESYIDDFLYLVVNVNVASVLDGRESYS